MAFRFFFVYFILYIPGNLLPFPLGYFPFLFWLAQGYVLFWRAIVPWVGQYILHLSYPITVLPNGSGDTTWNYVQVFCMLVLAAGAALIWSLLDRARPSYPKLYQWLRLLVRFYLASNMIGYGLDKVIPNQMGAPSLLALVTPYGQSSMAGVLWKSVGASPGFEMYTGWVETIGGLLLMLPRTTVLGALVSAAALTHVFALNLFYDVPVKLFSFHLLLLGLFLLAPELSRLANLFLLGGSAELTKPVPLFSRPWLNRGTLVLQIAYGPTIFLISLYGMIHDAENYGFLAPRPPFYGIWSVVEFKEDGQLKPALIDDDTRWQMVIFNWPGVINIYAGKEKEVDMGLAVDLDKKTFTLSKDKTSKSTLSFAKPGLGQLTLAGDLDGHHLEVKLMRVDESKYELTHREFHWISEHPNIN